MTADFLFNRQGRFFEMHGRESRTGTAAVRLTILQDKFLQLFRPAALRRSKHAGEHFNHRIWDRQMMVRAQPLELLHGHSVSHQE